MKNTLKHLMPRDRIVWSEQFTGDIFSFVVQNLLAGRDERGRPCIFYALESRSKDVLQFLMSQIRDTECIVAADGESVLHIASRMGDVDIMRRLLKLDLAADLVDHQESENGRAPLHLAVMFNHIEIAKELLDHGARFDRQDITGRTQIFIAAYKGHSALREVFPNPRKHEHFCFLILKHKERKKQQNTKNNTITSFYVL